jgi:putative ABC transport system ATP-binding protein
MGNLLDIVSLTKVYHNGREKVYALKEVSFLLKEEDYIAVVGPSGAGKSTLLHIIGGIDMPTKGKVLFRGQDIYHKKDSGLASWRSQTVGFVFQFYHLIEELNVLENIAIAACSQSRKTSLKRAEELLKYLGLSERKNFFPSQLSGGEKQKTAIARALINEPEIILCDEPTGNLDKDSQDRVVELLEKLNKGRRKTIVIVTHNLELARRAKRMITLKSGEIAA